MPRPFTTEPQDGRGPRLAKLARKSETARADLIAAINDAANHGWSSSRIADRVGIERSWVSRIIKAGKPRQALEDTPAP